MELLQLHYFLTAASCQHMTRAAESLHIAQPALSQAISRLENELGLTLFDRKGRGIVLNESGELLQQKLTPLLASLDSLPQQLMDAKETAAHTIRLSLLAASSVITSHIIAYRILHPEIKFRLCQNTENENYDIRISTTHCSSPLSPAQSILCTEAFYLAVPVNSQFAQLNTVILSDTFSEEYISLSSSHPVRAICDRFCQEAGFSPNIIYESDNPETVRNAITAGLGIGFWPACTWGPLSEKQVRLIPVSSPSCRRNIIMTLPVAKEKSTVISDFSSFLRLQMQQT